MRVFSRRPVRTGFSLIELLIVMSIIALLAGLLLPAVQKAREAANRASCMNNLHQLGLAFQLYHNTSGCFPTVRGACEGGASWAVLILPYLEQNNLYSQWNLSQSYYQQSDTARQTPVKIYYCPSRRSPSTQPELSVSGDSPTDGPLNNPWAGTLYPGALADYAVNMGSTGPTYT
jgi:prepilin-type N-terminal cleavage/methylation domain-containing protein